MKCAYIGFFTMNSVVIFLKYTFEFVLNTARLALKGVRRRKFHRKSLKQWLLHLTYLVILSSSE